MKRKLFLSLLQATSFQLVLTASRQIQTPDQPSQQNPSRRKRSLRGVDNIFDRSQTRYETRIVGGGNAISIRFPYYAYLYGPTGHCGGSLIAPDLILTAAHCSGQLYAHVGRNNLFSASDYYEAFSFTDEFIHPLYSADDYHAYDQKIIQLSGISTLEPIQLQMSFTDMPATTELTVIGFGAKDTEGRYPSMLQQAAHWYIPEEECESITLNDFSFDGLISDDMMCAAGDDGVGVCFGDSGGPLISMGSGFSQDVLVGIVSWGIEPCGDAPGVFQKASGSYDWIRDTVCSVSKNPPKYFGCPTVEPSSMPTAVFSNFPSSVPSTSFPSAMPSDVPSLIPSTAPTDLPSGLPSVMASDTPSLLPSDAPSLVPSGVPSDAPSNGPSLVPSGAPSGVPSLVPSGAPSMLPSTIPSDGPSLMPSTAPSTIPSDWPSLAPSGVPSPGPSAAPSQPPRQEESDFDFFETDTLDPEMGGPAEDGPGTPEPTNTTEAPAYAWVPSYEYVPSSAKPSSQPWSFGQLVMAPLLGLALSLAF